jgi:hypothetical protein
VSTVTNSRIEEGAAMTAASIDDAFTDRTAGFNAIEDDDFADNAFGHETVEPIVVDAFLFDSASNSKAGGFSFTPTSVHPTFDPVVINSVDMKAYTSGGGAFEVGPASPDKIKGVLVGASFQTTGNIRCAIGVLHSGSGSIQIINETDFPSDEDVYEIEWFIDNDEVPAGETISEVWLMAADVATGTVAHGQIWTLAVHG